MRKVILYIIAFILFVWGLSRCHSFALEEEITGNYYLTAPDAGEQCRLSYNEDDGSPNYGDIISETVFAVGFNDNYMIVKQHPTILNNFEDKTITNYYILPLKKGMNWYNKNGLVGPLTLTQFNNKRKELKIEDIQFTKVLKDLE